MTEKELLQRTKQMALRVIAMVRSLPKYEESKVLGRQVLRSATSVAANYRSACKARSRKDFVNKLGIAEEEADVTQLWIELIVESKLLAQDRVNRLYQEVKELTAILASSRITAQRRSQKLKIGNCKL